MAGLGKERTAFGEYLDKIGVKQERISEESGLTRNTISRACNDLDYVPKKAVQKILVEAARKLSGRFVSNKDFWE